MITKPFIDVSVQPPQPPNIKHRYSVTGDIVAFRRCARQYGTFRVQNYAPAHQTQLYFGEIIHQVLDRCHNHYHGIIDPTTKGTIPNDGQMLSSYDLLDNYENIKKAHRLGTKLPNDIIGYFIDVENGLKSRGVWAINTDLRLRALRVLQCFNALEGPELYPKVRDTEYRLQADRGNHILNGVVDLLLDSSLKGNLADFEIWDYKGTNFLDLEPEDLKTYEFQMRVYARLYELKNGVRPRKAVLYFLGILGNDPPPKERPVNALYYVNLTPESIQEAMDEFTETVGNIKIARDCNEWKPAEKGQISDKDCAICDLRWDCPTQDFNIRFLSSSETE